MIQKKTKASLTAALFTLLALSSIPVATGASTADDVEVDVAVAGTSVLDQTVWINAAGPVSFDIPVDASSSTAGGVNTVAFKLAQEGAGQIGEGLAYSEGAPVPEFTGAIYDSELDEQTDASGFFWQVQQADERTECDLPEGVPGRPTDCVEAGTPLADSATFQVTVDDGGLSDFAAVPFELLTATDNGADPAPPIFMLGLDTATPTIDSFGLLGGSKAGPTVYTDVSNLRAEYVVSDALSGVGSVEYKLDNAGFTAASGGSIDLSGLAGEGSHSITLRVTDAAGNFIDSTPITFDVDTVAPVINNVVLAGPDVDGLAKAGETVTLTFDVSEAVTPTVQMTVDGISKAHGGLALVDSTYTVTYAVQGSDNGPIAFTIDATDLAGNTATQQSASGVTADTVAPVTTPPTVTPPAADGQGNYWVTAPSVELTCSDVDGSGCAGIQYNVNGGAWQAYTGAFTLPDGDDQSFQYRSTDLAGNTESDRTSSFFDVDTTAPSITDVSITSDNGDNTLATIGDTITVTYTVDDGTFTSATIAGQAVGAPVDNGDGTHSVSLAVSNVVPEGTASASIVYTDAAGNAGSTSTIDTGSVTVDYTGPTADGISIASDAADPTLAAIGDTITVSWTSMDAVSATGTIGGGPATADDANKRLSRVVDTSFAEGPVVFSIDLFDAAGNPTTYTTVTDASSVNIEFGDLVATTVTSVSDTNLEVGDTATIAVHVTWAEDPPGSPVHGSDYAFGRVTLYADGVAYDTRTTNSQGVAIFTVTHSSVGEVEYVARAVGFQPNPGRVVSESGDLVDRTETITYDDVLVDTFAVVDELLAIGETAQLDVTLKWASSGDPAIGLDATAMKATVLGMGGGNDPRDLVPDTPTSGDVIGFTEIGTSGVYRASFPHNEYESLRFSLGGGPLVQTDGTTFSLPSVSPIYAHWVGAYVESLTYTNLGDALDGTGDFVNLADSIQVDAEVVYTPNYDPSGANGLLGSGQEPAHVADGTDVVLRETSYLDTLFATANAVTLQDTQATTNGIASFTVDEATFTQGSAGTDLRNGANTYGIQVFPTVLAGIGTQAPTAPDAADVLDVEDEVTFTALDLVYVASSATGVEDGDVSAMGIERWWLGMDNAKGDADTDPLDADALEVQVHVTWRHDGADANLATVKVHDGIGFLNDGTDFTGTTDAAGLATLTIDPDTFSLDALVKTLEFQAVEAPEPATPAESIVQTFSTASQEVVWSRVALLFDFDNGGDGEVDLGATSNMYFVPVYYHDASGLERPYYHTQDYDAKLDGLFDYVPVTDGYTATLTDNAAFLGGIEMADQALGSAGVHTFSVFGGCSDTTDATTCANNADLAQAGWHKFTAGMSAVPHNLPVDESALDVLFTAVVIDADTDRITAPVETAIGLTAQAYYAHTTDVNGDPIANLPYTNGVMIDVNIDAGTLTGYDDVALDNTGALTATIPSPETAMHDTLVVAGLGLVDDTSEVPLTLVHDSASMERVWLEASIELASGTVPRTDFTDRDLQVRGRAVEAYFDVTYTDGVDTFEVDDVNEGYTFSTIDDNPDARFDRTRTVVEDTAAATVMAINEGSTAFTAVYSAACDGVVDNACWVVTASGSGSGDSFLEDFDLSAVVPLTKDADGDIATSVSTTTPDAFDVQFTSIVLDVIEAGNVLHQADLVGNDADGEFWYNLADAGTFQVTAKWAHDNAAATGGTLQVEDPAVANVLLAGATIVESVTAGTYDVTIPAPATSIGQAYSIGVSSMPSTEAGEPVLADSTPFTVDADSLTAALEAPHVVHTRAVFDWTNDDIDGIFLNRGQQGTFGASATWEHLGDFVDQPMAWNLDVGGEEVSVGMPAGSSFILVQLSRSTSQEVTILNPEIAVDGDNLPAPRGITDEAYDTGDDAVTLTWTAVAADIDDDLDGASYTVGTTVEVAAYAFLEHDAARTGLVGTNIMKLMGTAQNTVADAFDVDVPGAKVSIKPLNAGTFTATAEGHSYNLAGIQVFGAGVGGAITATSGDTAVMNFTP